MVLGRSGSSSCGYFHTKMRGTRRTAKLDRSKPALFGDPPAPSDVHLCPPPEQTKPPLCRATACFFVLRVAFTECLPSRVPKVVIDLNCHQLKRASQPSAQPCPRSVPLRATIVLGGSAEPWAEFAFSSFGMNKMEAGYNLMISCRPSRNLAVRQGSVKLEQTRL